MRNWGLCTMRVLGVLSYSARFAHFGIDVMVMQTTGATFSLTEYATHYSVLNLQSLDRFLFYFLKIINCNWRQKRRDSTIDKFVNEKFDNAKYSFKVDEFCNKTKIKFLGNFISSCLTLFYEYTLDLGIVVLNVMVPQPYGFSFAL